MPRIITISVALLLVSSGCMGILDSEPASFSADPLEVRSIGMTNSGYDQVSSDRINESRELTAGGQTQEVRLTNHRRTFERDISEGGVGEIALYSTPLVEIADETIDPVGDWSEQRLANELLQRHEDVRNLDLDQRRSVSILARNEEMTRHTAVATVDGESVDVTVQISAFRHSDDVVVVVAAYPRGADEQNRLDRFIAELHHG